MNSAGSEVAFTKPSPYPPLQGHGADVPPPPVQTVAGLLDGVALRVATACVGIVEQDIAEREHRRHALGVLLDVPLQVLQDREHGFPSWSTRAVQWAKQRLARAD